MTGTIPIREATRADVRPMPSPLAETCHDLPATGRPTPEETDRQPALDNGLVRMAGETVAVHAGRHRRSLGCTLLAHTHAEWDNDTVPAYTQAADDRPRNPHLRHGHHHLSDITPPDGATLPAMRRHPNPTNTPRDR